MDNNTHCTYVFVRGFLTGKYCGKPRMAGSQFCEGCSSNIIGHPREPFTIVQQPPPLEPDFFSDSDFLASETDRG